MAKNDDVFLGIFARWLVALRKRVAMTQVQFAGYLGIYPEAVSRWENAVQAPSAPNLLKILALATPHEREALIEKSLYDTDDTLKEDMGAHLQIVQCEQCGRDMRIRDFTTVGWPAPPMVRKQGDPYAVKVCPRCQTTTFSR